MSTPLFELDRYMIRRKVLKIFGASFHVYDEERVVGFSNMKAFRLKEDIRVFASESMGTELLSIHARQIIDFSAAYDILDSQTGEKVGAARRKGITSMVRDSWEFFGANDAPIAVLEEDSMGMAMIRRFVSNLVPQKFHLDDGTGAPVRFTQRFNPFIYKLEVEIPRSCELDRRLVFGAAVLIAAIEGRQK